MIRSTAIRVSSMLAAACLFAGVATAQADKSPVGDWTLTISFGGNEIPSDFIVSTNADGSFKAVAEGTTLGTITFEKVTIAEGKINFAQTIDMGDGNKMDVSFDGMYRGNAFDGTFTTSMGPAEARGIRKALGGLVGRWDVTSNSQAGELKRTLTVNKGLSGTYASDEAAWDIRDINTDGEKITFGVTVSLQGQDLPLNFEGKVEGDALKGQFFADGNPVSEVSGTRVKPGGLAELTGSWDVTVDSQIGVFEQKVKFAEGKGTYTSEGDSEVTDLKESNGYILFKVSVTASGTPYALEFEGQIFGDVVTGDFFLDGAAVAKVTAKRAK